MDLQSDATGTTHEKSLWRTPAFTVACTVLFLYTFAPVISVVIAELLAAAAGSGSSTERHTIIFGHDLGPLALMLDALTSLMLFTIPTGMSAIVVLTIAVAMASAIRSRKSR